MILLDIQRAVLAEKLRAGDSVGYLRNAESSRLSGIDRASLKPERAAGLNETRNRLASLSWCRIPGKQFAVSCTKPAGKVA